jgi:hypothetical protein
VKKDSKKVTLDTGIQFAKALVEKSYVNAHSMLTADLQRSWPVEKLRSRYEKMIQYGAGPVIVDGHTEYLDNWPARKSSDIGWVYVSISGADFAEAVTVVVADENGTPKISSLEWGRP